MSDDNHEAALRAARLPIPPTSLDDGELEEALRAVVLRHYVGQQVQTTPEEQAVFEEWQRRHAVNAVRDRQRTRHHDVLLRYAERQRDREHEQHRKAGRHRAAAQRDQAAKLLRYLDAAKAANPHLKERGLMRRVLLKKGQPSDAHAVEAALRRVRRARLTKKKERT